MNERFATLMSTRDTMLSAAAALRKAAAAEKPATVEHKAAPALDMERVRNTFEDLVADGLAKKADVETAMEHIGNDPNRICDVIRNVGEIAKVARKAVSENAVAEAPGTLVGKTAAAEGRRGSSMSALFSEQSRLVEARVAGHRNR